MRPETNEAGSPGDWLLHARSDLAIASVRKSPRVMYANLCFHAQQAAEKSIKAVLAQHEVSFGRSHDLAYLLGLLPPSLSIPVSLVELPVLNKFAVQYRYPGDIPVVDAKQRKRAVRLALDAVEWAARCLKRTD